MALIMPCSKPPLPFEKEEGQQAESNHGNDKQPVKERVVFAGDFGIFGIFPVYHRDAVALFVERILLAGEREFAL